MAGKVILDERGIMKTQLHWTIVYISWDDIQSWTVYSYLTDHSPIQVVSFRLKRNRKVIRVTDCEVCTPGIENFLEKVRKYAPSTEVSPAKF